LVNPVRINVISSSELSTDVTFDQESAGKGTQGSRTSRREHQETVRCARRRRFARLDDLRLWIAEYVVSSDIIITTLALGEFGINLRPTIERAEDGLIALAIGLWVPGIIRLSPDDALVPPEVPQGLPESDGQRGFGVLTIRVPRQH
jgi:hypothetical protein